MGKVGRPSYTMQLAEALEDAIDKIGDIKTSGQHAEDLSAIYDRLMLCKDKVRLIWDNQAYDSKR